MALLMADRILRATYAQIVSRFSTQATTAGKPTTVAAKPILAYVNHGRWVAACPCGSVVAVAFDWPHAHCPDCLREHTITWPTKAKRACIEEVLILRPMLATQNWGPGETIAALVAENRAHGLPGIEIPEGVEKE
jgi:hypothetical protein